jgi:NAD(P)-dependent dehydrogenase (short-subunit alcohol dehydrogenase family)
MSTDNLPTGGNYPFALIVGGTSGLGLAVTERLLSAGYQVTTVGRRSAPQGVARHYVCDLGDCHAWRHTLRHIVENHSEFTVTAFIAGFARAVSPGDVTPAERQLHYRLNADYVADACAAISGLWKSGAAVFTVGSQWTYRSGCPWIIPYIMAKHALLAITCEMAAATKQRRVRHYCVPTMATPAYAEVRNSFATLGLGKEFAQLGLESNLSNPEEVAKALLKHLVHDDSSSPLWRVRSDYAVLNLPDAHMPDLSNQWS